MDETVIVIMLKDKTTGFLDKELTFVKAPNLDELIYNIYAINENGKIFIYMRISTDFDVENWQYNAIYDYYDTEALSCEVLSITEIEDTYNPTWEVTFEYTQAQGENLLEEKIVSILTKHKNELLDVCQAIEDKREEYNQ